MNLVAGRIVPALVRPDCVVLIPARVVGLAGHPAPDRGLPAVDREQKVHADHRRTAERRVGDLAGVERIVRRQGIDPVLGHHHPLVRIFLDIAVERLRRAEHGHLPDPRPKGVRVVVAALVICDQDVSAGVEDALLC